MIFVLAFLRWFWNAKDQMPWDASYQCVHEHQNHRCQGAFLLWHDCQAAWRPTPKSPNWSSCLWHRETRLVCEWSVYPAAGLLKGQGCLDFYFLVCSQPGICPLACTGTRGSTAVRALDLLVPTHEMYGLMMGVDLFFARPWYKVGFDWRNVFEVWSRCQVDQPLDIQANTSWGERCFRYVFGVQIPNLGRSQWKSRESSPS